MTKPPLGKSPIFLSIPLSDQMNWDGRWPDMYLIEKLKSVGIPAKGVFKFKGVERGTLTMTERIDSLITDYVWHDD